jgi:hypothetical protein
VLNDGKIAAEGAAENLKRLIPGGLAVLGYFWSKSLFNRDPR